MKRRMLFLCAIIFLIVVVVACATFKGNVITMNDDKSSIVVKSDEDMKEYAFECYKGAIASDVMIGDHVVVQFKEEGNIKRATRVRKVTGGC